MTFIRPAQRGHDRTSAEDTRRSSSAQGVQPEDEPHTGTPRSLLRRSLPAPERSAWQRARAGSYSSHSGLECLADPAVAGARRELVVVPSAGDRYYLVTAAGVDVEGPSGFDSLAQDRDAMHPLTCGPAGCP